MNLEFARPVIFWDIGSATTRLFVPQGGVTVEIPTVLLRNPISHEIFYTGEQAERLQEKPPINLEVVHPMRSGKIADYSLTTILEQAVHSADMGAISQFVRPEAVVIVMFGLERIYLRALKDTLLRAGFGTTTFVPQAIASCVAHDPELLETGVLVWDSGAGKTEVAAVSGGDIVRAVNFELGGELLDRRIRDYLKVKRGLEISLSDAAKLKHTFGFGKRKGKDLYLMCKNLKLMEIEPVSINPDELKVVIETFFEEIIGRLRSLTSEVSPSLMRSCREAGILLTGGLSQIEGIDDWLSDRLQFRVKRQLRQNSSALLGAAKLKSDWKKYSYLSFGADD